MGRAIRPARLLSSSGVKHVKFSDDTRALMLFAPKPRSKHSAPMTIQREDTSHELNSRRRQNSFIRADAFMNAT
jgi:hypothetical protein